MAITMANTDTSARVPAWKRIGLKLKYAKDTADEESNKTSTPANTSTQQSQPHELKKRAAEESDPETPAKRTKATPTDQDQVAQRSYPSAAARGNDVQPEKFDSFWSSNRGAAASTKTPKKIVFGNDE